MTEPLTLLIVEDETLLAEMHRSEYIRHIPRFNQICWRAIQKRMMIDRFKPRITLLIIICRMGRGLRCSHELRQRYPGGVVYDRRQCIGFISVAEAVM